MANGVTQTGRNMPYPAQIQSGKVESSTHVAEPKRL